MEIIKVNEVEIDFPIKGGITYVPIKPICEVLGIDHSAQVAALKNNPILSSVMVENPTTGKDGKTYLMLNLPMKYFFGWLFSIDARKVKPEAYETVIRYQEKVYDLIYDKFYLEPIQQKKKLILILEKETKILNMKANVKDMNAQIKLASEELEEIKITRPDQLSLDFPKQADDINE